MPSLPIVVNEMIKILSLQALSFAAILFLGKAAAQLGGGNPTEIAASGIFTFLTIFFIGRQSFTVFRNRSTRVGAQVQKAHLSERLQLVAYLISLVLFATCMWKRAVDGQVLSRPDALLFGLLAALAFYVLFSIIAILRIGIDRAKAE